MKKKVQEKRTKLVTNTYMREAIKYKHLIINENDEYCITIKKYIEMSKPFVIRGINFLEDGAYLVECTPLNDNYNIRFYINKNYEFIDYYVDISYQNGLLHKVPYYIDLYLDIVDRHEDGGVCFVDEDELALALENKLISKRDYNFAYKVGNRILKEIKEGKNKFLNMDIIKIVKESCL